MYTLQILDAGQTFLHTLGDQAISLGAAEEAHVRLRETGVAPIHARLEPHSRGIRLTAEAGAEVRVNGEQVQDVQLQLGDRVELGHVVMIVGKTVSRAASPEDVLASSVSREPRIRRSTKRSSKLVPILVGVAALVGVIFMATQGDDSSYVRGRIGDVEHARTRGDVAAAREQVANLRREWAGAEDDRLRKLHSAELKIDRLEAAHDDLVAQVSDPKDTRTYAEWSRKLQTLEAAGTLDEQIAARKLRSRLRETLRTRDERIREAAIAANVAAIGKPSSRGANAGASGDPVTANVAGDTTANSDTVLGVPSESVPMVSGSGSTAEPVATAEIEKLCNDGHYAQALSLVQAAFDQAFNPETVKQLQVTERSVQKQAAAAMSTLLAEARSSEQQGRLQHAVTLLQMARHNFPSGSTSGSLGTELERLQAMSRAAEQAALAAQQLAPETGARTAVDAATRLQTLESLRSHMAAVREAEDHGDFAQKAVLLRQAAVGVRSRDGEFADRLVMQADEAAQLAGWNAAVVAAVKGGAELRVEDRRGREVQLVRVDRQRLIGRSADGDAPLEWHDINADSMQRLAEHLKASGSVALGLAAMLYMNGDADAAESVLANVVRQDDQLQPDIDLLLARGRGESGHSHSYVLRKGAFVSLRQIELKKISKKLVAKLAAAMRKKDRSAGNKFVAATVAEGELQAEALGYAMRTQFAKIEKRVDASAVRKNVDKMVAERDLLDAARKHAKDLIFDSVTYFYPYKPPAVSGAKHAEYNRVQADVNERVAAVRAIWSKSSIKLNVPIALAVDLQHLDWLATKMSRYGALPEGESIASMLAPMAWAQALEPGEVITVHNFCLTPEERWQRAAWRRIEAFNAATKDEVSPAARQLLKITNHYRRMFGHRPLAGVKSACAGSQGHADEMSRLGYFSHMSPVPGRRTPGQRMRLAGYTFGVSENIAISGGALSAHNAWCTSSGHHRNLLMASHREIGIGANGRYWVQNFGSGEVHKTHMVWPTLTAK